MHNSFCVVVIGTSAGGVRALEQMFARLPEKPNLAFIVVQHLNPDQPSAMPEILRRCCQLPVMHITEGLKVLPNQVHLAPPGFYVSVNNGSFHLTAFDTERRFRLPIDYCFKSVAHVFKAKAIGVILSGTGHDGTLGVKAIKEAGGFTLAQQAKNAEYDGMPRSAIEALAIDRVVPIDQVADELLLYSNHPYVVEAAAFIEDTTVSLIDPLERIFALLRIHTGHDFAHYKRKTIVRRVERRMAVHQLSKITDYLQYLQQSKAEIGHLFKELLINVTSFFRDPESFEVLKQKILPRLLGDKTSKAPIRIWVPGCASGEEAYSLAMLFVETAQSLNLSRPVQVFATDIDNSSLEIARHGFYTDACIGDDVTPERLQRFFKKEAGGYQINKQIRDMVIIAKQDLIKDPPFSKLDLVVCRNLLIYFSQSLQKKVLPLFHYTLNPHAFLMLGPSETIGGFTDLFSLVDKKWKIFQRENAPRISFDFPSSPYVREADFPSQTAMTITAGTQNIASLAEKLLLDNYAPPCVIVNDKYDIIYFHGRTTKYLELPSGEASLNILKMAREELRIDLRSALHKVLKLQQEEIHRNIQLKIQEDSVTVNLTVKPLHGPKPIRGLAMVIFEEMNLPRENFNSNQTASTPAEDQRIFDLEH